MERSSSSLIHCSCFDLSGSDLNRVETVRSFSAPGLRASLPELPRVRLMISTFKSGISGRIHVCGRENQTRALTKRFSGLTDPLYAHLRACKPTNARGPPVERLATL
eukprot:6360388-Pyramimonas_sp.AAC.1